MKPRTPIMLFALLLVCQSAPASLSETETLKGITAVCILVEDLPPEAAKIGLTTKAIQTDVELKLRLAGMKVVTVKDQCSGTTAADADADIVDIIALLKTLTSGALDIRVTILGLTADITISLVQSVFLARNRSLAMENLALGTTWSRNYLGLHIGATAIRDRIKDEVDEFLNDWLSVNPKSNR